VDFISKYALENFPEECAETIKTADEITDLRFCFDPRRGVEPAETCVVFDGEIDWLHQPGEDPEWVYAFNRMAFWVTLGQAYAITGDEKYAHAFVSQLSHWISTVPRTCRKAWRSIDAGLRLNNWGKAVRFFESSPSLTSDTLALFRESIKEHAEFLMNVWDPFNLMSNWGVLSSRGLFVAGVILPESARTREYTAEAARRLSAQLRLQVYRDGSHWEQSPAYHHEVLVCCLDVIQLAEVKGIGLPENILRQTRDMCYFSMFSAKPDHSNICMGDSDSKDNRGALVRAAWLFRDNVLKSRANTSGETASKMITSNTYGAPGYDILRDLGQDGLSGYAQLSPTTPDETDKAFRDSGNYYFRSGWETDATFVHFHCGTLGAGHGHADKLHFDVFSRGQDVLVDAGRFTYVFGLDRVRYKEVRAHNSIMADGKDFYICKDSWQCGGLTRGINQKFYSDGRYGYAEGGHLAYIGEGLYVNRRLIYLKPDIIILADELYASGQHSYNQFFHFNSAGKPDGGGNRYTYRSRRVTAEILMLTKELTSSISQSWLSRQYGIEETGSKLTTIFGGEGFTGAFTVIALSDPREERELKAEKLSVRSTFKGLTFTDSQIEAIDITFGESRFTVVVAHEEFASPTDTFETGGCTGFGSCVVFNRAAGETEIGTVLLW